MLRITEQRAPGRLVLKLEGRFLGNWVGEVDACWRAATGTGEHTPVWVDLTGVSHVDVAGLELLSRMHGAGVRFVTQGCEMPELVRAISESRH